MLIGCNIGLANSRIPECSRMFPNSRMFCAQGDHPWPGVSNAGVMMAVSRGKMQDKPKSCPPAVRHFNTILIIEQAAWYSPIHAWYSLLRRGGATAFVDGW